VGVPETFEEFFQLEHERVLRAFYLVTGDREEAEDLVQDAFVKVFERWEMVRTMAAPTGYVFQTAMNGLRSKYRRAVMAVRRIALITPRSGDACDEVDVREDVRRALTMLTRRQRAAIVLTELLGYPAEEAARILSIKSSTVRALTTQARTTMRSILGETDD
jgi:RNA polymerase sigma factor (sigma-70 family)